MQYILRSSTPSVGAFPLFRQQFSSPAVSMSPTVFTSYSSDEAIMGALVLYWEVKVIHVMARPCTVAKAIRNRTISTLKRVDAIFFAISVLTAPFLYGVAFKERPKLVSIMSGVESKISKK